MANIFFLVFCIDVFLYAAAQFRGNGHYWAAMVCSASFGACDYPQLLLLAIFPLFGIVFLAHRRR